MRRSSLRFITKDTICIKIISSPFSKLFSYINNQHQIESLKLAKTFLILMPYLCLNIFLTTQAFAFKTLLKDSIPCNIRIVFDLKEKESITLDGMARVTEGVVEGITGMGFEHDDKIYTQNAITGKEWTQVKEYIDPPRNCLFSGMIL